MSTKKTPTLVEIGGGRGKDFIENGWSPIVSALAPKIAVQSIPEYELAWTNCRTREVGRSRSRLTEIPGLGGLLQLQ